MGKFPVLEISKIRQKLNQQVGPRGVQLSRPKRAAGCLRHAGALEGLSGRCTRFDMFWCFGHNFALQSQNDANE